MSDSLPPPLPPRQGLPPIIGRAVRPPPLPPTHRPGVVLAYRWWCVLFMLLYFSFSTYEILVAQGEVEPSLGLIESALSAGSPQARAMLIADKRAEATEMAVGMAAVALLYGAAAGISRKPGSWTLGLVVICTTLFPFVITAAGMVPLIIHWVRPEIKRYFNRRP